jgi:uncharacterized OB-fold protein
MAFMIEQCTGCDQAWFPARYCCPRCGAEQWRLLPAGIARVAQATVVRARVGIPSGQELHLTSVELSEGPVVVAQTHEPLPPGTRVELAIDDQRRITAYRVTRDSPD